MTLQTERIILRQWRDDDIKPFAEMNADPEVMRYFVAPLTYAETQQMVERTRRFFEKQKFGWWATEIGGEFAGFVGLSTPKTELPCGPCVEVGWRLAKKFWNKGYATEAARAAVADGFSRLKLKEIVSFTAELNLPSIRVMQKLGMTRTTADDFLHPSVPDGHKLKPHVLYRIKP